MRRHDTCFCWLLRMQKYGFNPWSRYIPGPNQRCKVIANTFRSRVKGFPAQMKAEKTHSLEDKISKSSITHVLPPLCKFSLYQGASLYFLLALLLARYSPLYLSLFYSLSHFFRRILPILVSPLTFLRVFLDSLYVFYFLFFWSLGLFLFISFSLKTLSLHKLEL